MLIVETQEECVSKLQAWKADKESKGFHLNRKKTKFLVSEDDQDVLQKFGKNPCAFCCTVTEVDVDGTMLDVEATFC